MATEKQVQDSIANVASGNAGQTDHERVAARARVAGRSGNQATTAQSQGAQDKSKSWGW